MSLDVLQAVFWSLTYISLIAYSIKYRSHGIPLIAMCLNFAWETPALIGSIRSGSFSTVLLLHSLWFVLDLVMVVLYLFYETNIKEQSREKRVFLVCYAGLTIGLSILFFYGYMLLSSFIIDLIMAISFVLYIAYNKCLRYRLLYLIGILKLLGDMFAWRYYGHKELINIIGSFVLVCNIAYMIILVFKDIQNISGNKSFHYNQFAR